MNILPSVLLALVSFLLPLANAVAQEDQDEPTAILISEPFSPLRGE